VPVVPDLTYRWLPVIDGQAPPVSQLFEVSAWLGGQLGSGGVLISCREGRGRSALLACATLMQLGYSVWGAYQVVRRGQPNMVLSDDQMRALEGLSSLRGSM
jgi:protein-tyrosine phosphatase